MRPWRSTLRRIIWKRTGESGWLSIESLTLEHRALPVAEVVHHAVLVIHFEPLDGSHAAKEWLGHPVA